MKFKNKRDLEDFIFTMLDMLPTQPEEIIINDQYFEQFDLQNKCFRGFKNSSINIIKRSDYERNLNLRKEIHKSLDNIKPKKIK